MVKFVCNTPPPPYEMIIYMQLLTFLQTSWNVRMPHCTAATNMQHVETLLAAITVTVSWDTVEMD